MYDCVLTIGCFDKIHKDHINLLENIKNKSKKIIIGLYDNSSINKLKNITNIDSYDNRKKNLENYAHDIFIINNIDPTDAIQQYILKNDVMKSDKIEIGSSKTNNKVINNDYKGDLYFINNYKDTFKYSYKNDKIIITRTDQYSGWGQHLIGYKKKIGFFCPNNKSKYINNNKKLNYYLNQQGIYVEDIKPILMYSYDSLEKYDKMKIDWVVGWINPDRKNLFKQSHNIQRLRDNNELLYFLKSVYKYANWINKIYIILALDSKPPKWFKQNDKIVLIQETSLYKNIQKNSETKKLFYGMIPNISNLFIAGDDDYLLGDYIYKSEFFTCNSVPIVNKVNWDIYGGAHIPIAWSRNNYNIAVQNINNRYYLNMADRRDNPWTPIKKYLLYNNKIINGNRKSPDFWINDTSKNHKLLYNLIKKSKYKYICINDDWDTKNNTNYCNQKALLNNFYESFLPEKYDFMK